MDSNNKKMKLNFLNILFIAFIVLLLSGCASVPQEKSPYIQSLYKRVPYDKAGRFRVVSLYYATNRQMSSINGQDDKFGSQMSDKMSYGILKVMIDPALGVGTMLPLAIEKSGLMKIKDNIVLDEIDFYKELKLDVDKSPHNSLLVMVFGYNNSFENNSLMASYSMYSLDANTPVLLFDWPGDKSMGIREYKKASNVAKLSGPYLGNLLGKIIRDVKPVNLWIESASLGCQVVCDAFDEMHEYPDLRDQDLEIAHVILAAPDVGNDEFDEKFKNQLSTLSKKLTTYVSSDDEALLMSVLVNREKRLGRQKGGDPAQLEETKDLLYLKSLDPDKITVIDVTPINQASFRHGYYLESPEFFDDFYNRLFDKEPNINRRLYLLKADKNTDYWVMSPGR